MKLLFFITLVYCVGYSSAAQATSEWVGQFDSQFFTGGNWLPGGYPTEGHDVTIPDFSSPNVLVSASSEVASVKSLNLEIGSTLTVTQGQQLNIHGSAGIIGGGHIVLESNSKLSLLSTSGNTAFKVRITAASGSSISASGGIDAGATGVIQYWGQLDSSFTIAGRIRAGTLKAGIGAFTVGDFLSIGKIEVDSSLVLDDGASSVLFTLTGNAVNTDINIPIQMGYRLVKTCAADGESATVAIEKSPGALVNPTCAGACPEVCGDPNQEIGVSRLADLLTNWNQNEPSYDYNCDGVVDINDLANVLTAWGSCANAFTTTLSPTTLAPTTESPTTDSPTSQAPTTEAPTTDAPTTEAPTSALVPTTDAPTTVVTPAPTGMGGITDAPTTVVTTPAPTGIGGATPAPTTVSTASATPTTEAPTTEAPTTEAPTTAAPTTEPPITDSPTSLAPTSDAPTSFAPTSLQPTTDAPTSFAPTTFAPTSLAPTNAAESSLPTTFAPTTIAPTSLAPTSDAPTSRSPTSLAPTSRAPTSFAPTGTTSAAPTEAAPMSVSSSVTFSVALLITAAVLMM